MKKLSLLIALAVVSSASATHAAQNYSSGNLLLGIGLGAGTANAYPIGSPQMAISPSVEIIFGAWNPGNVGIALGGTVSSSVNFFGYGLTGSIAVMPTLHITLLPRFDWYVGLGLGLQMLPAHDTSGHYNIHVGFQTGFNIVIHPQVLWNFGLELHANQFFGTTGAKIRFGNYKNVRYK